MRLLQFNSEGRLSLTSYHDDKLPPYAILSHTWLLDDDEVTFDDVQQSIGRSKAGFAKIMFCGRQAQRDGLKHFWVDSCCIKQSSDAELSQAINKMYDWYAGASKCYVYLQDVTTRKHDRDGQASRWVDAFRDSTWFTRGWTLQELLAPKIVEFWSRDEYFLGTKETLKHTISIRTGIPLEALGGCPLAQFHPNERRRWAADRDTTREEDKAYCLLGLFGVHMSAIYGEGKQHAFLRLEREIRQTHEPSTASDRGIAQACVQQRRQDLLASLAFEQIEARHSTIKDAQRMTCEWILQSPEYVSWNERDERSRNEAVLWIAGKPGAGKSTLMKFALARAKKSKSEDDIILSFFFNARGDEFEKNVVGMYRSLLFQLLKNAPDLQIILDNVDDNMSDRSRSPLWTCTALQTLWRTVVEHLRQRRLKVFIDALDECDEQQIRDMVDFFEDLADNAFDHDSRLHMCFASRHYPTITIRGDARLVLEDQAGHTEDIRKYVRRHLQVSRNKLGGEIQVQVQEKANGVFMWAVLVVDMLNKEIRGGRMYLIKRRLRELPSELSNLFKGLLRRDRENMQSLLLCLQWILFSRRPLRREEFYFAMITGLQHDVDHTDWQPEPWNKEEVNDEDMKRFVLDSSKGLAELTKSSTMPTVQFIHESVRDFLLKEGGLCELWPELNHNLTSLSHDSLKTCCSRYMAANLEPYTSSTIDLPKASSDSMKALRRQISEGFPFLEYASQEILYHANEAACDVPQLGFLHAFPLRKWIFATNVYEHHEVRRHGPRANICYLAAEENLQRLLETLEISTPWLRLPDERYQFPVIAAFANGHKDALRALLCDKDTAFLDEITDDPGFGKPSEMSRTHDLLLWTIANKNWALAKYLLTSHSEHSEALVSADTRSTSYRRALQTAAVRGATAVVRLLLAKGVRDRGNALESACSRGDTEIVQMLLDKCDYDFVHGTAFRTAFETASAKGHLEVAQLLEVEKLRRTRGASIIEAKSGEVLRAASRRGHYEHIRLLLEQGKYS